MNYFPCPGRAEEWDLGPVWFVFDQLYWARVCTEFPGQAKSLVLLCKWGKLWAVLSFQVSL